MQRTCLSINQFDEFDPKIDNRNDNEQKNLQKNSTKKYADH